MQGILIVNKPRGMTSHDVVSRIRRLFGTRQVGHTGTLDPDAEGVLPILIGRATKLSDILTAETKRYKARVRLGIETDTYDASGTVIKTVEPKVSREEIILTAERFLGKQNQIPPMYSAIKQGGKKLYELARKGVEIERPAREITIYSLTCEEFNSDLSSFSMTVECSKGTYIRSLCHDLGKALGCGAHMEGLVRTASGSFTLENAYTLEEIAECIENETAENLLISICDALSAYPEIVVSEENAQTIRNGLRLRSEQLTKDNLPEGMWVRFSDASGLLCLSSVMRDESGTLVFKIEKTFYSV